LWAARTLGTAQLITSRVHSSADFVHDCARRFACHIPALRAPTRKQKSVARGLRCGTELDDRIQVAVKQGGFSCSSAFIRAAIERELAGRESGVDAAEQRIAASLDRMAREIRNLRLGQQALFAFVDVLAKTLLTCVPEPPKDAHDQAVARGKARYDRFLKSVGMGMVGDSQAALSELLGRGKEN
jgi:Arc/MetJ-type ribon-helix-helix transcriptional regulator